MNDTTEARQASRHLQLHAIGSRRNLQFAARRPSDDHDIAGADGLDFSYTYDANKNKTSETIDFPMGDYGFDTAGYDDEDLLTSWDRIPRSGACC